MSSRISARPGAPTACSLSAYPSVAALPGGAQSLLDGPGAAQLFTSRPWFETFEAAGMEAGARPLYLALETEGGNTLALLACQSPGPSAGPGAPSVAGLTSFYSCDFRPVVVDDDPAGAAFALGVHLARRLAKEPVVRLDSLDPSVPTIGPLLAGMARPFRALLRYEHFGHWWEDLGDRSFDAYLGARDGALREVVRRKGNRLSREGAQYVLAEQGDLEEAIAQYETVYARSWKEAEPFPEFQPTLMRKLAAARWLRLAICRIGERPIAAQLWAVVGGRATVLKLAHDSDFDKFSPGTVLTAFAIRTLMERDRVRTLDFGRGDDPYKRAWTGQRTQHEGVLWANSLSRPGLVGRHRLGALLRRSRTGRD